MSHLDESLADLAEMSIGRLRAEWRRLHRSQIFPSGLGRDLATRGIAFRLQEAIHGGLQPTQARYLSRLAKQLAENGAISATHQRSMKLGTKLVRRWHGQTYHVVVVNEGFEFRGRHYRSLSPIAREITGVAWSGPLFFGLKDKANDRR